MSSAMARLVHLTAATFMVALLGIGVASAQAPNSAQNVQVELDALIQKAKAEGELLLYAASVENDTRRLLDGFTKAYGIKATFLRLASGPLQQRFSTEAAAGTFAADVFLSGSGAPFLAEGLKNGWLEPISEARIPVLESGQFPARFNRGGTAVYGILPWGIAVNTDRIKDADAPKAWNDLLDPKYKGLIGTTDAKANDSMIEFWVMVLDKYGESFLSQLRTQGLRASATMVPAAQSLGAGEVGLTVPMVDSAIAPLKAKGAPVKIVVPTYTTGSETHVFMVARKHVKHPNAARLFAHYVLSPEGNRLVNGEGSVSVYDLSGLPGEYQSPKADALTRKEQVYKLLGN